MVFNSWSFLPFFLITLALYYAIRNWRSQKALLLVSSYVFYALRADPIRIDAHRLLRIAPYGPGFRAYAQSLADAEPDQQSRDARLLQVR